MTQDLSSIIPEASNGSAEACLEVLKGIAGSTWGMPLEGIVKVYDVLVILKILFDTTA